MYCDSINLKNEIYLLKPTNFSPALQGVAHVRFTFYSSPLLTGGVITLNYRPS